MFIDQALELEMAARQLPPNSNQPSIPPYVFQSTRQPIYAFLAEVRLLELNHP
jgi:hypothetical protein